MGLRQITHHIFRLMYRFAWIPEFRHKVLVETCTGTLKAIAGKIPDSSGPSVKVVCPPILGSCLEASQALIMEFDRGHDNHLLTLNKRWS